MTRDEAIAMTERLVDAAVGYEQAGSIYVGPARRELFEARAAIENALCEVITNDNLRRLKEHLDYRFNDVFDQSV